MDLVQGKVKVELEYIGEGWNGDYSDEDPNDEPLLRFTVYQNIEGKWEQVDNASYCTRLPETLSDEGKRKTLEILMNELSGLDGFGEGFVSHSIKKPCESLSWLSREDVEGSCPTHSS